MWSSGANPRGRNIEVGVHLIKRLTMTTRWGDKNLQECVGTDASSALIVHGTERDPLSFAIVIDLSLSTDGYVTLWRCALASCTEHTNVQPC